MRARLLAFLTVPLCLCFLQTASGQANLPIYTDHLVNGFQDWSWATRNLANTTPTHTSTNSISVTGTGGISFHQNNFNTSPYGSVSFWAHGGTAGGQLLQVNVTLDTTDQAAYTSIAALTAGTWTQITIPLSSLGAANKTNLSRVTISLRGSFTGTYYLDDIQINGGVAPALVHLGVDFTQTIRAADNRWFGVNDATWDGYLGNSQTVPLMRQIGITTLRWPGGSTSDGYHWYSDTAKNTTFNNNAHNLGATVFITANYGNGTSNEAAAWVKSVNVTNSLGFKYWEIGNECYGTWENDANVPAHDPYTYAVRAAGYIAMMKAADPTIKIGVVGATGEDSYVNNTSHSATNSRTLAVHNGWTPVMLATLKKLGVTPDFFVHHVYPEYTAPITFPTVATASDSDALVLQAGNNWASDAANLRQMLSDYLGSTATNVELICTENNSDSGGFGKQLTSIVNGLYIADNIAQIMKTEFNGYLWWDFRNGQDATGSFDPTLYGWRTKGDEGMVGGATGPLFPTFYAEKLMQNFVRAGDTVLKSSSDYLLLSSYAAKKANGSLALLVINKDTAGSFTGQISVTNFIPNPTATIYSYGILQDEAARTSAPPVLQDIYTNTYTTATNNFSYTFLPLTITLFTFSPAVAPSMSAQPTNFTVIQGNSASFYVTAAGTAPLSYQWRFNSVNIPGATNPSFTIGSADPTNAGLYSVWVTNIAGSILSSNAALTVLGVPVINTPPTNQTVQLSSNATFAVSASGAGTLLYQWYFNFTSNPLQYKTNASLPLGPVGFAQGGSYFVIIANSFGSVTSTPVTLTVIDTIAPTISACAPNTTIPAALNCSASLPDLRGQVSASDASGSVTVSQTPPPGTSVPVGTTQVTLTATDSSANSAICHATVTVLSTATPVVNWSFGNTNLSADASCSALMPDVTGTNYILASEPCNDALTITQSPTNKTMLSVGTNQVVITIANVSGVTAYSTNTVVVADTTGPVITILGSNPFTNECHTTFVDPGATAADACSGLSAFVTNGIVDPTTPGLYILQYVVTDGVGNNSTNQRAVYVVDSALPVVTLNGPNPMTVECHSSFTDPGASALDACAGPLGVSVSGSVNPNSPGVYILTYSATDPSGNVGSASRTVNVGDTTPPAILSCVTNVTLDPTNCLLLPDLTSTNTIVAIDNCSSVSVSQLPVAGTLLPPGTNTVLLTVADASGNTNTAIVSVVASGLPYINTQPADLSVILSSNAALTVSACGPDLTYQWRHASGELASGTNPILSLQAVSTADAGDYDVIITNSYGSVTSSVATVTVLQPPVITTQPQSLAAILGGQADFSVAVSSIYPVGFQWRTNNTPVTGQTGPDFTIPSVQSSDFADYTVMVTNVDGSVLSDVAHLTLAVSPVMSVTSHNSSGITFNFPTQLGPNYLVEYTLSLSSPSWQLLGSYPGTGSPISVTGSYSTNRAVFYRVHLQ